MLTFIYLEGIHAGQDEDELLGVTDDRDSIQTAMEDGVYRLVTRNDIESFSQAEEMAAAATSVTGEVHVAVDNGDHHYPRHDVVRAPHVGDEVSYAFNGDYYPAGKVAKISDSLRAVTLESGMKFWRLKKTGSWKNNGTWSLIQGHIDRQNPHI